MLIALVAIPLLIRGLGNERFGLLSLIWMVVGYFSIFDLGLGRALTRTVAEKLEHAPAEVPAAFWTAMMMMLGLGAAAGALVYAASPWLVEDVLTIDPPLQPESLRSFRSVALALPLLVTVTGLIGALEACRKFPLINLIRMPMGAYTFAGPLLVLPFRQDLLAVVWVLLAGRIVEWLLYFAACLRYVPGVRSAWAFDRQGAPRLLSFGGWMTVSNIVQPLMVHIDRFLIGAIRAVSDVAFYATSAEIVVKLLIFPRAWVSVLFPAFAAEYRSDPAGTGGLMAQSVRLLLALMFPATLILVAFAPEGLALWLGPEYGLRSAPVMRWLAAGILLHSLAFVPASFLQGIGRPDLTAKLHAVELPIYLALAGLLIHGFGIEGAAATWLLRAAAEFGATAWLAGARARGCGREFCRIGAAAALCLAALALVTVPDSLWMKLAVVFLLLLGFSACFWFLVFTESDRRVIQKRLPFRPGPKPDRPEAGPADRSLLK